MIFKMDIGAMTGLGSRDRSMQVHRIRMLPVNTGLDGADREDKEQ